MTELSAAHLSEGKVTSLFKGVKAMLRHEQPDIGESKAVDL